MKEKGENKEEKNDWKNRRDFFFLKRKIEIRLISKNGSAGTEKDDGARLIR